MELAINALTQSNARPSAHFKLGADDLEVVLAMVRTGSLAVAGERLGLDPRPPRDCRSRWRRDADIAVRATRRPPQNLVGRQVGSIRMALYAGLRGTVRCYADVEAGTATWIAPDEALPDHPSVIWRKRPESRHLRRVSTVYSHLAQVMSLP